MNIKLTYEFVKDKIEKEEHKLISDVDNCITYCKNCHEEVHRQEGCKRSDMRRKKCK